MIARGADQAPFNVTHPISDEVIPVKVKEGQYKPTKIDLNVWRMSFPMTEVF